jgi:hypothetical protein
MTLLIALANECQAVLLADRRVSSGSVVLDDEYNKVTVLACEDARLAVAFTGLATIGAFNTSEWLTQTLSDICQTTLSIHSILSEFELRAGVAYAALSANDRRVTFLFCGFVHSGSSAEPRIYTVTNFECGSHAPGTFSTNSLGGQGQSVVATAGMTSAIPDSTRQTLYRLLAADLPSASIVRFAVKHLQNAARNVKALNWIGEHCTAAIISCQINTPIITTYHTSKNSLRAFCPNVVIGNRMISFGIDIMAGSILAGPEIRKQDPCWCGSGVNFKHCHLKKFGGIYVKLAAWKKPLIPFQRLDIGKPWATGQNFLVIGGYE